MVSSLAVKVVGESPVGLQDIFLRPVEVKGEYRERLISMKSFDVLEQKMKGLPDAEQEVVMLAYHQIGWLMPQLSAESQRDVVLDFHEYWSHPIHLE